MDNIQNKAIEKCKRDIKACIRLLVMVLVFFLISIVLGYVRYPNYTASNTVNTEVVIQNVRFERIDQENVSYSNIIWSYDGKEYSIRDVFFSTGYTVDANYDQHYASEYAWVKDLFQELQENATVVEIIQSKDTGFVVSFKTGEKTYVEIESAQVIQKYSRTAYFKRTVMFEMIFLIPIVIVLIKNILEIRKHLKISRQ